MACAEMQIGAILPHHRRPMRVRLPLSFLRCYETIFERVLCPNLTVEENGWVLVLAAHSRHRPLPCVPMLEKIGGQNVLVGCFRHPHRRRMPCVQLEGKSAGQGNDWVVVPVMRFHHRHHPLWCVLVLEQNDGQEQQAPKQQAGDE